MVPPEVVRAKPAYLPPGEPLSGGAGLDRLDTRGLVPAPAPLLLLKPVGPQYDDEQGVAESPGAEELLSPR